MVAYADDNNIYLRGGKQIPIQIGKAISKAGYKNVNFYIAKAVKKRKHEEACNDMRTACKVQWSIFKIS